MKTLKILNYGLLVFAGFLAGTALSRIADVLEEIKRGGKE